MKIGIATWGFGDVYPSLSDIAVYFAQQGFEALSFLPEQILNLDEQQKNNLNSVIESHGLITSIHGACHLAELIAPEYIKTFIKTLGNSLYAISLDSAMAFNSCGYYFDAKKMQNILISINNIVLDHDIYIGIEDFPLDNYCLEQYRESLSDILICSHYGVLIDIGHANIRLKSQEYFSNLTYGQYMERIPRRIFEVHVHDNDGSKDLHLAIGEGNTDFKAVIQGLKNIGFNGMATIQIAPFLHNATGQQDLPKALASLSLLKNLWGKDIPD